jgi:hypothetical protein
MHAVRHRAEPGADGDVGHSRSARGAEVERRGSSREHETDDAGDLREKMEPKGPVWFLFAGFAARPCAASINTRLT